MSTHTPPMPLAAASPPALIPLVINGSVHIPGWIVDHESFRAWTHTTEFPQRGRFSWLDGTLWVDLTLEELYSHNQVKTEWTAVLGTRVATMGRGLWIGDGMHLSIPAANVTTVPDGQFVSFAALQSGRVKQVPSPLYGGVTELEGAPEMVLDVVSDSSVEKDTVVLPPLYHQAGVVEFWRVDARGPEPRFEILRSSPGGWQPTQLPDDWWRSDLFGRDFRLTVGTDPLGMPLFTLESRP